MAIATPVHQSDANASYIALEHASTSTPGGNWTPPSINVVNGLLVVTVCWTADGTYTGNTLSSITGHGLTWRIVGQYFSAGGTPNTGYAVCIGSGATPTNDKIVLTFNNSVIYAGRVVTSVDSGVNVYAIPNLTPGTHLTANASATSLFATSQSGSSGDVVHAGCVHDGDTAASYERTGLGEVNSAGMPGRISTQYCLIQNDITPNFTWTGAVHALAHALRLPQSTNQTVTVSSGIASAGAFGTPLVRFRTFQYGVSVGTGASSSTASSYNFTVLAADNSEYRDHYVFVGLTGSSTPAAPTSVTGLGLTWTKVGTDASSASRRMTLWRGVGTPNGGTTLTVSFGYSATSCCVWLFDIYGGAGIVQSKPSTGSTAGYTQALDSSATSGTMVSCVYINGIAFIDPRSGWTESADFTIASAGRMEGQYCNSNSDSTGGASFTGAAYAAMVVEMLAALLVMATGIDSAEAFGTATTNQSFGLTGIASAEALGTATTNQSFALTGIASAEALGTLTVNVASSGVTLTGIASEEAFGTAVVNQSFGLTGIASAEALGTATTNQSFALTGIASAGAFGTSSITSSVSVTLTGIASAEAFGTLTVNVSTIFPQTLTLTGIASAGAMGTALVDLSTRVNATGIVSGLAFGTLAVQVPPRANLTGIASGEAFGIVVLHTGQFVQAMGIPSGEDWGIFDLIVEPPPQEVSVAGLDSLEVFGEVVPLPGVARIISLGIPSAEAINTIKFFFTVYFRGISTAEAHGRTRVLLLFDHTSLGPRPGAVFDTSGSRPAAVFDTAVLDKRAIFGEA